MIYNINVCLILGTMQFYIPWSTPWKSRETEQWSPSFMCGSTPWLDACRHFLVGLPLSLTASSGPVQWLGTRRSAILPSGLRGAAFCHWRPCWSAMVSSSAWPASKLARFTAEVWLCLKRSLVLRRMVARTPIRPHLLLEAARAWSTLGANARPSSPFWWFWGRFWRLGVHMW